MTLQRTIAYGTHAYPTEIKAPVYQLQSLPANTLMMSSPATTVRQRGGQSTKKAASVPSPRGNDQLEDFIKPEKLKDTIGSEWDYKLGLAVITTLAFITRFWGIGHPNEVVFDEVHFGKVSRLPDTP